MKLAKEQSLTTSDLSMRPTPKQKLAVAERVAAALRDMQREVLEAREPSLGMLGYLIATALSEAESQVELLTRRSDS
jgi:hypothetical protein